MNKSRKYCAFICAVLTSIGTQSYAAVSAPSLRAEVPEADKSPLISNTEKVLKGHAGVSQEYILGPGDVLSVTDMSEDKPMASLAPVLPDGTAIISFTGVMQAAGKSLREMNDLVNLQAKKWYVSPQIVINLAKQRPTTIYLLGEVVHPGLYSAGGESANLPSTGGSSGDSSSSGSGDSGGSSNIGMQSTQTLTLSGALQLAGGLKETADVRHVRVTRQAPQQTHRIDLWKLMIDGDVSEDITLQPGDVVWVPKGGTDFDPPTMGKLVNGNPKVRVFGAVKQPGLLTMGPEDDYLSVIAKAGGWESTANRKFIMVARTNRDGTVSTEKISVKKGMYDGRSQVRQKVHPGDVIIVKTSAPKAVLFGIGRNLPQVVTSSMVSLLVTRFNTTSVRTSTIKN